MATRQPSRQLGSVTLALQALIPLLSSSQQQTNVPSARLATILDKLEPQTTALAQDVLQAPIPLWQASPQPMTAPDAMPEPTLLQWQPTPLIHALAVILEPFRSLLEPTTAPSALLVAMETGQMSREQLSASSVLLGTIRTEQGSLPMAHAIPVLLAHGHPQWVLSLPAPALLVARVHIH